MSSVLRLLALVLPPLLALVLLPLVPALAGNTLTLSNGQSMYLVQSHPGASANEDNLALGKRGAQNSAYLG